MGSFVGSDVDGANSATLTGISWPAVQSGDTALIFWTMQDTTTPTTPTGFTQYETFDANSGGQRNYIFWKNCSGSESGTLTLTVGASNRQSAVLWIARGYDTSAPIEGSSRFDETASLSTHNPPAYTLINANCGIVTAVAERATNGTDDYTPPTTFNNNHADTGSLAVGSGGTITAVASDDLVTTRAASTVVDPTNWSSADPFSTANAVVWTLALKPLTASSGSASLAVTAAFTASGALQVDQNQAPRSPAPMFVALHRKLPILRGTEDPQTGGTSTLAVSASIAATGQIQGAASLGVTATIAAAGQLSQSSDATRVTTATITASGQVAGSSVLALTALIIASGGLSAEVQSARSRVTTGSTGTRGTTGNPGSRIRSNLG